MTKPESNNEFGKYEKEFSRLMQEAVEKHVEENAEPLNIDYSFLNDYENVKVSAVKKRSTAKSFARVAVILIVFFCGVSVAMITDLPTNASAWKAQLARRLYVLKEGFVSSDPDVSVSYTDENTQNIVIDDFSKMEKVKNIIPQLLDVGYIPDEYSFDTLKASMTYSGTYNAIYKFIKNNNEYFSINIYYNPNADNMSLNIDDVVEKIELEERNIYIWRDLIEGTYGYTIVSEDYTAVILGNIDKEEILKIADGLK